MKQVKFERYLSKNIPSSALASIRQKVDEVPMNYQGKPATGNSLVLWNGYQQRKNVEPKSYNVVLNKDRIAVSMRTARHPETTDGTNYMRSDHQYKRKVQVYQIHHNHMQSTPMIKRNQFAILFETIGYGRSMAMLWGRGNSNDPYRQWGNRFELLFPDMESAVGYSKQWGWGFDTVYPHERFHERKSYADNFNYTKESVSDLEDDDETVGQIVHKLI
jgi:hypothetical protein